MNIENSFLTNKIIKLVIRFLKEPAKKIIVSKKIFSIIFFLSITLTLSAQYIQFSQFYAAPLVLAPSFAGTADGARVTLNYRDQWTGLKHGIYVTEAFAFDIAAPKVNSGFGLLVVRDRAGEGNLGRTDFGVVYSWHTQISQSGIYFRPGLELKMSQRGVDLEKLVFPDQLQVNGTVIDTSINPPPPYRTKYFMDATFSVMFYSDNFWIGVTADHLFRPNDAFYDYQSYRLPIKYQSFGGYKFGSGYGRYSRTGSDSYMLSYNFRYQAGSMQLDLGGYWNHDPLQFGIWLRGLPYLNVTHTLNMDALVFLVGYKIFNFRFGYSYDLTVSPLLMSAGGSHEISLIYTFSARARARKRHGAIPCPGM